MTLSLVNYLLLSLDQGDRSPQRHLNDLNHSIACSVFNKRRISRKLPFIKIKKAAETDHE